MGYIPQPLLCGPALVSSYQAGVATFTPQEPNFHPAGTPPGFEIDAGSRVIDPLALTYAITGHVAAGSAVIISMFNPNHEVVETDPEHHPGDPEFQADETPAQLHIIELGVEFKAFGAVDSKGNKYEIIDEGVVFSEWARWRLICQEIVTPLEPGDTLTVYLELSDLGAPFEELFPFDGFLAAKQEKGEYPFGPGDPLFGRSANVVERYKRVPHEVGFYAFATVFVGHDKEGTGTGGEVGVTKAGVGNLASANNHTIASGVWTGSATPQGAGWLNLFNATSHGFHMNVDWHGPPAAATYIGKGTGDGHLSVTPLGPGEIHSGVSGPAFSETVEFVGDTTLGEGEGAAKGVGKRLTVTVGGKGYLADAGHIASGVRVADGVPTFNYFMWPPDVALGSTVLSPVIHSLAVNGPFGEVKGWLVAAVAAVRNAWREVRPRDRMPMPGRAELRIRFKVTGHTNPRWLVYGDTGEDAFTAGFVLGEQVGEALNVLTGDLYEGGVLVGSGVPLEAGDATTGVEFVITEDLLDGLGEAGKEKKGEWENLLAARFIGVYPTLATRFNELDFEWEADISLYFAPHAEPAPLTMTQAQAISLSFVTGREPPEPETPPKGGEETPEEEKEKIEKGEETTKEKEEKREREEREANGETGTMQIESPVSSGVVTRNRRP